MPAPEPRLMDVYCCKCERVTQHEEVFDDEYFEYALACNNCDMVWEASKDGVDKSLADGTIEPSLTPDEQVARLKAVQDEINKRRWTAPHEEQAENRMNRNWKGGK